MVPAFTMGLTPCMQHASAAPRHSLYESARVNLPAQRLLLKPRLRHKNKHRSIPLFPCSTTHLRPFTLWQLCLTHPTCTIRFNSTSTKYNPHSRRNQRHLRPHRPSLSHHHTPLNTASLCHYQWDQSRTIQPHHHLPQAPMCHPGSSSRNHQPAHP